MTDNSMAVHPDDSGVQKPIDGRATEPLLIVSPYREIDFASAYSSVAEDLTICKNRLAMLRDQREAINDKIAELVELETALEQATGAFERRHKHLEARHATD